jgi:hypothetical protein
MAANCLGDRTFFCGHLLYPKGRMCVSVYEGTERRGMGGGGGGGPVSSIGLASITYY